MTAHTLPGIGLTGDIEQGAPWKVAGDANWMKSSVLTQLAVESMTTSLPPSPLNGVIYIVPAADPSGNQIAARDNGAWVYFTPQKGWTAYVRDTGVLMNFDGAAWVGVTAPFMMPGGAGLIGWGAIAVPTMADLPSVPTAQGLRVSLTAFHGGWSGSTSGPRGGGLFTWDATRPKAHHNGGTVVDPLRAFPSNWANISQQDAWFAAGTGGNGCWVFCGHEFDVLNFGAKVDNVVDDSNPVAAIIAATPRGRIKLADGNYKMSKEPVLNRNNLTLWAPCSATFIYADGVRTNSGFGVVLAATASNSAAVNCNLENINIDIYKSLDIPSGASNQGGVFYTSSRSEFHNCTVLCRGDNMIEVVFQALDDGSGPYYNLFNHFFLQGTSTGGAPLVNTKSIEFRSSAVTPSRSPNSNVFRDFRMAGVNISVDGRGCGNVFRDGTHESINQFVYYFDHPTVTSGAISNFATPKYIENQPTVQQYYFGANASGNGYVRGYTTGVNATEGTDESTLKNNIASWGTSLLTPNQPLVRAQGQITTSGLTVAGGFNVASVAKQSTGVFRVNFTKAMPNANYAANAIASGTDVTARESVKNTAYVQFYFFDAAGAAADPVGFDFSVSR